VSKRTAMFLDLASATFRNLSKVDWCVAWSP
jgi:hypothetical protein